MDLIQNSSNSGSFSTSHSDGDAKWPPTLSTKEWGHRYRSWVVLLL